MAGGWGETGSSVYAGWLAGWHRLLWACSPAYLHIPHDGIFRRQEGEPQFFFMERESLIDAGSSLFSSNLQVMGIWMNGTLLEEGGRGRAPPSFLVPRLIVRGSVGW